MALRLEITAPGEPPREVALGSGRTSVPAGPGEQYRLLGAPGEIPPRVRILRFGNALLVTGLADGLELELGNFFGACRPGRDCTLSFAAAGAPDVAITGESPAITALNDGSFLLHGPAPQGLATQSDGGGAITPKAVAAAGLAALVGIGAAAGAGGGGGGDAVAAGPTAVLSGPAATSPGMPAGGGTTPAAAAGTGAVTPPAPAADTVAPTLRITDATAEASTNRPTTFSFRFSEPVIGFDASDVTVVGGTAGALVADADGLGYTMTVTPAAGVQAGMLSVEAAAGAAADAAGNPSAASGATQGIDTRGPTVTVTDDVSAATTRGDIRFAIAFDEPVTGFDPADVTVTGGTIAGPLAMAQDGRSYALTVSPRQGAEGEVVVEVRAGAAVDALGNATSAPARAVQAYDTAAPTQRLETFRVDDDLLPRRGRVSGGDSTNDDAPTVTLTLDRVLGAGETLTLSRDGAAIRSIETGRSLVFTDAGLPDGRHQYTASLSDAAGNLTVLPLGGVQGDAFVFFVT